MENFTQKLTARLKAVLALLLFTPFIIVIFPLLVIEILVLGERGRVKTEIQFHLFEIKELYEMAFEVLATGELQ